MYIYKFCYRTAFTREVEYYKAESYEEAYIKYHEMTNKRYPIRCYLDIVWKCDENAEPIERIL